jgi:hypothetical protein
MHEQNLLVYLIVRLAERGAFRARRLVPAHAFHRQQQQQQLFLLQKPPQAPAPGAASHWHPEQITILHPELWITVPSCG